MVAPGLRHYQIQLVDLSLAAITTSGGKVTVCTQDTSKKATLKDSTGAAASNPVSLTRGNIEFYTASSVQTVDIYGIAPGGQAIVAKAITASGPNVIRLDTTRRDQVLVVPGSYADQTADATETSTGIALPTDCLVKPLGHGAYVAAIDAGITLEAGILSTESGGDADGFLDAVTLATAKTVAPQNTVTAGTSETYFASTTIGALIQDFTAGSDVNKDVGTVNPKTYRCDGTAKTISYTISTGADTAQFFILVPYELGAV